MPYVNEASVKPTSFWKPAPLPPNTQSTCPQESGLWSWLRFVVLPILARSRLAPARVGAPAGTSGAAQALCPKTG